MPRGVYPRKKTKPREKAQAQTAAKNGNLPEFNPIMEDLEVIASVPSKARNGGNSRQIWGQPYEADAREFDAKDSPWERLYHDAMLRLEKTPASKAIVYPFDDDYTADRARKAVTCRVRSRRGSGVVRCGTRREPPRMYIRRGPNWKS